MVKTPINVEDLPVKDLSCTYPQDVQWIDEKIQGG